MGKKPRVFNGRYQEVDFIDEGGFGSVFKAIDLGSPDHQIVAVKRVAEEKGNPHSPNRLQIEHEVKLLEENAPRFPFIPNFYDHWVEEIHDRLFHHYIVMEYIDGETLDDLRSLPWTSTQVSGFLATLLGYLQQLHDAGIVHRDIKPLNIKRADRGYVILDFGISTQNTHTLVAAHSPDFAAPEQIYDRRKAGVHVDARTDLYCLAATAYYLLTNSKPTKAIMRLEGITLRHSEQFDKAPSALQQTLLAMLALEIDKRPASAAEALARLRLRDQAVPREPREAPPADASSGRHTTAVLDPTELSNAVQPADGNDAAAVQQPPPLAPPALDSTSPVLGEAVSSTAPALQKPGTLPVDLAELEEPSATNLLSDSVVPTPVSEAWQPKAQSTDTLGEGRITDIAWSPNGQTLAVATAIGVYTYNLNASPVEKRIICLTRSVVQHVGFVLNGAALAVALNEVVEICDAVQGGKARYRLDGRADGTPGAVVVAPDNGTVLVAAEGQARLLQLGPASETDLVPAFDADFDLDRVALSRDGRTLAAATNGDIKVWRLSDRQLKEALLVNSKMPEIIGLALSRDATTMAAAAPTAFTIWRDGKLLTQQREEQSRIRCIALAPDGKLLAVATQAVVQLWRVERDRVTQLHSLPQQRVLGVFRVVFDLAGQRIAAASHDDVWVWDVFTGREIYHRPHDTGQAHFLAFTPDGQDLAIVGTSIQLWGVGAGQFLAGEILGPGITQPRDVAFASDGNAVAVATEQQVLLWQRKGHAVDGASVIGQAGSEWVRLRSKSSSAAQCHSLVFSKGKPQFLNVTPDAIECWPLSRAGVPTRKQSLSMVCDVALSPDGVMAALCQDRTVSVHRASDWQEVIEPIELDGDANGMALAPDGRFLAVAFADAIQIYRLPEQAKEAKRQAPRPLVRASEYMRLSEGAQHLVFAPDGLTLAAVKRTEIRLWDVHEDGPSLLCVANTHTDAITDLAFGHGLRTFASASYDGTVRLWRYGQEVGQTIEDDLRDLTLPLDPEPMKVPPAPAGPSRKPSRALNIFIAYASEDREAASHLYGRLKDLGHKPWMDKKDLVAGQDWRNEIAAAIEGTDSVIVCLSGRSIKKQGYIQKEFKYAIDIAEKQPKGDIFIIPLRIEECIVPEGLTRWHRVDFFRERGWNDLLRALEKRAAELKPKRSPKREPKLKPIDPPTVINEDRDRVSIALEERARQIAALKELRNQTARSLNHLNQQRAKMGVNTPPYVHIEIEDSEQAIAKLDQQIAALGGE